MAGKYTKPELRAMLHRSVFHIVAEDGIERVTVRKVSSGCGLSDPYIYQCYSDLPELMENAFMEVDGKVVDLMNRLVMLSNGGLHSLDDLKNASWTMWKAYWDFLMRNPEQTIFYWRYYQSGYYTRETQKARYKNYASFISYIVRLLDFTGISDKINLDVIMSNIIDNTVSVAVKIHLGFMKPDEITARTVYQSAFALIFHMLGIDVWGDDEVRES